MKNVWKMSKTGWIIQVKGKVWEYNLDPVGVSKIYWTQAGQKTRLVLGYVLLHSGHEVMPHTHKELHWHCLKKHEKRL